MHFPTYAQYREMCFYLILHPNDFAVMSTDTLQLTFNIFSVLVFKYGTQLNLQCGFSYAVRNLLMSSRLTYTLIVKKEVRGVLGGCCAGSRRDG